ncbi:MAG: fibronectin type III domain-containing protein, partial [Dolichospermum sp.]
GTTASGFPWITGGADGSRVVYTYNPTSTPPTVSAPTGLTSPSQTSSSIDLSWTDASNEHGYVLYYSTASAAFNTSAITSNTATQGKLVIPANSTTASITGISSSSPYYIKLFAVRGDTSAPATTSVTLPEEDVFVSAVAVNQASTGAVVRGQSNVPLLRLDISTGGNANSYFLSSLNVSLPSGSVAGTISGLRVYRTTTTSFNTSQPLSSGLISFTGSSLTINAANAGSVLETEFNAGTNYIWITGDIASNAAYGATADLRIQGTTAISFSSGDVTPTTPDPTGVNVVGAFFDFETSAGPFINITEATTPNYDWVLSNMPAAGTALGDFGSLPLPGVRAGSTGSRVWGTNSTSAITTNTTTSAAGQHDIYSLPLTATGAVTFNFWNWWSLESASTAWDNVFFF